MDSSLEEKVGQLSVESGHENSEWEECFDENSGNKYWYNSLEGKSTWDDPFDNSANGGGYAITVADAGEGDSRALVGDESKEEIEEEDYSGLKEALSCFTCPPLVPKRWTDFGNSVLFHGVDNPSPFFRVNVFKAENPYREAFKPNEDVDHSIWTKKMILYTFRHQMPNTVYYNISYAMNPYRTRLLPEKLGSQLKRDISRWGKSREEEECGFWAFPVHVPGSELFYVDWTSSPDRYSVTTKPSPEWQWTRCFNFFAYTANKFHVLECKDPLCYKIVEGHHLGDSAGMDEFGQQWNCILAFFAFKTNVPGTNCYYVQEQEEPHYRTRIGMEASRNRGWTDSTKFFAFDTAMPGTCKLSVQYTTQSVEAYTLTAEQFRIYTKDPWGIWENKFQFYAFPSETVLI